MFEMPAPESEKNLDIFCRQVRGRSNEHKRAVAALSRARVPTQIVSILRQELDSMVRVIYLLSLSDLALRDDLIKASVEGRRWKVTKSSGKRHYVTDREMVELSNYLQGWTKSVYEFGCAFIHLSNFHDYRDRDPMNKIPDAEKEAILSYMLHYHRGPASITRIEQLIPYLPRVFDKIASNLECYVRQLQNREVIAISSL